jgi:hypothetical protein
METFAEFSIFEFLDFFFKSINSINLKKEILIQKQRKIKKLIPLPLLLKFCLIY